MNIEIAEAEERLLQLVDLLTNKEEEKIVICKDGLPLVVMAPYKQGERAIRIGVARDSFPSLSQDDFDSFLVNDLIEKSLDNE